MRACVTIARVSCRSTKAGGGSPCFIEQRVFDLEQSDVLGARFASFCGKLVGTWGRLCLVLNYPAALSEALAKAPDAIERYTRQRPPWYRPEDYEHMLDGLRKAGWQG